MVALASQEGAAIIERAPYVDVVFGPQTLHRLPAMLEKRQQQKAPQVDISFLKSRNSTICRLLAGGLVSLRVHHGRLLEVLQLLRGALTPVAKRYLVRLTTCSPKWPTLADQGEGDHPLGQNVNGYRGKMGDTSEIAGLRLAAGICGRDSGH